MCRGGAPGVQGVVPGARAEGRVDGRAAHRHVVHLHREELLPAPRHLQLHRQVVVLVDSVHCGVVWTSNVKEQDLTSSFYLDLISLICFDLMYRTIASYRH